MKKVTFFGFILVMLTGIGLILSCEGTEGGTPSGHQPPEIPEPEDKEPPPDSIEWGQVKLVLFQQKEIVIEDKTVQEYLKNPAYPKGRKLEYSSNNESVATVDKNGLITAAGVDQGESLDTSIPTNADQANELYAKAYGEAVITVKTANGRWSSTIPVYVDMLGNENISDLTSLHGQFKPYIPHIGTIFDRAENVNTVLIRHFDILTAQNAQKPESWTFTPTPSTSNVDSLISGAMSYTLNNNNLSSMLSAAIQQNISFHFHALFWHEQNPSWWQTVVGGTGIGKDGATTTWSPSPLTYDQAAGLMKLWVDKIMNTDYAVGGESKPLKDWVYSWDVLNEVILSYPERLPARTSNGSYAAVGSIQRDDQGVTGRGNWTPNPTNPGFTLHAWGDSEFTWKDALRYGNSDEEFWDAKRAGNPWVRALGPDAVYLMFKYARLNAPEAILYINDYDTFRQNKAKMIYDMVVELNDRWTKDSDYISGTMLINAMGAQEHNNIEGERIASNGNIIVGTTAEGVDYNFSLWSSIPNMRIAVSELDVRVYDNGGTRTAPTLADQIKQAELFRDMFRTYLKYSNNANGSRFDRVTFWGHTDNGNWMSAGKPTMFDSSSIAKPAYYAVQQALEEYKAAHPVTP